MSEEIKKTKPKAKLIKAEGVSSKNLTDYAGLKREAMNMQERKKVALISKLTGLYAQNELDENEVELLRTLLTRERSRGTLGSANTYILNSIEINDCEEECYVKSKDAPVVLNLEFNKICKFKFDPNIGRNAKKEIEGRYIVFVPLVIPSDAQLSMAAARLKARDQDIPAEDLPPEKTLFRRIAVSPKEFETWFGYDDEAIIGNKIVQPNEFTF